jgi:hypothetical protein
MSKLVTISKYLCYSFFLALPLMGFLGSLGSSKTIILNQSIYFLAIILFYVIYSIFNINRDTLKSNAILLNIVIACIILSLFNSFDSLRISVIAAYCFSYLIISLGVTSLSVWFGIILYAASIFIETDGLSLYLTKAVIIGEDASVNIFGKMLLYIFALALINNKSIHHRSHIFSILILSLLSAVYIESRQLLIITFASGFYAYINFGRKNIYLNILAFLAIYLIIYNQAHEILIYSFSNYGVETPRTLLYSCFASRFDLDILFFGGYSSPAGRCANDLLAVNYLHSLYMEFIVYFGIFGIILITLFFASLVKAIINRDSNIFYMLAIFGFYGLVEDSGFWIIFFGFNYLILSGKIKERKGIMNLPHI